MEKIIIIQLNWQIKSSTQIITFPTKKLKMMKITNFAQQADFGSSITWGTPAGREMGGEALLTAGIQRFKNIAGSGFAPERGGEALSSS